MLPQNLKRFDRKGQGLSVNMIILIVIGLIVLIIAVVMVGRTSTTAGSTVSSCENLGGVCVASQPDDKQIERACDNLSTGSAFGTCSGTPPKVCCAKPAQQKPAS